LISSASFALSAPLRPILWPAGGWLLHPSAFILHPCRSGGFTYIGLLIFIAIMGVGLAGTGVVIHQQAQREKEKALLFVGDQFRRAIGQYYERSPGGDKRFPQSLEDLLLDKRQPAIQRYLRRLYRDPMTSKPEWGLVRGPGDSIIGVHSLSDAKALKTSGFPERYADFEGKESVAEWKFVYSSAAPAPTSSPTQPAAAGSQQPAPAR
jgi:type II secretory pathway pseudopilin PulG